MLCLEFSRPNLGLKLQIAFQKVNKVFGRNCLLFVFVLCGSTMQGAVDTPLYVSTTYIYSKPYDMTFPESTYYIHVYGLWMASPRDLPVACAFTRFLFQCRGQGRMTLSSTPCDGSVFVWISQIWLYLIVKSVVPNASAGGRHHLQHCLGRLILLIYLSARHFFFKMLILIANEHRKRIHSQLDTCVRSPNCGHWN